jgi:hypothetical protein
MQGSAGLHFVTCFFRREYFVDPKRVVCGRYASNLAGMGVSVSSLERKESGGALWGFQLMRKSLLRSFAGAFVACPWQGKADRVLDSVSLRKAAASL